MLLFLFAGKAYKRCDLGFLLHKILMGELYIYIQSIGEFCLFCLLAFLLGGVETQSPQRLNRIVGHFGSH